MKDRVYELCKIFNLGKFLNNDLIEIIVRLIIKIEQPQIIYNTRIYNLHRSYDINYINLYKSQIPKVTTVPLIRIMDKKFSNTFRLFLEKIVLINFHLKLVLKQEMEHNIQLNIMGGARRRRQRRGRQRQEPLRRIIINRYKLAFVKIKKIDINNLIETQYNELIINIYNKLETTFINNFKLPNFINNIYSRQLC